MSAKISPIRGAALVEVLIVIVLSSLLIGLFLHADLAVNRSIMRWAHRSGLEQAAISLGKQLRRDFSDCDSLHVQRAGEIDIFHSSFPIAHYSFSDSTVARNGRVLLPEPITVDDYSLDPLISELDYLSFESRGLGQRQRLLTITLERGDLATQTMLIPVRPYVARHIA